MWALSLNYHITNVLGFFVTYAFNQYRNRFRRTEISESGELYLQLWNYDQPANEEVPTKLWEEINPVKAELEKLPTLTALVLSLQFDLPMKQNLNQLLLWKLRETNHDVEGFFRDWEENVFANVNCYRASRV